MAGWLHGVFVGDWLFVFPLCGFSLSLFCNYQNQGSSAMSSVSSLAVPTRPLFWSSRLPQTMHNCLVYIMHARELGQWSRVSSIAP